MDDETPQAVTSVEDYTVLDPALLDVPPWDFEQADPFSNPRLQHVHRRSISEPPKSPADNTQPVVFHRELHATRKPKRTHPYTRGSKRSPRLVSLSENSQQTTWHHLHSPQTYAPISDSGTTASDAPLQAQTLSLTGKRTVEPVLRITMLELREIIATTVLRTVHECQLLQRAL